MNKKFFLNLVIIFFWYFYFSHSLHSQSFFITDIDVSGFPEVKAKFYAFDSEGNLITNPSIIVQENGLTRPIFEIKCPPEKPPVFFSSVLTIDASGSMSWNQPTRLEIAKGAARTWINSLPVKSECAITSFDDYSYIVQDFTTDKTRLLKSIETITPGGGTNYNAAFINPPAGGILVAKNGKYKRCLVFLSDGEPNFYPDVQKIIDLAKNYNVTIYCVTLLLDCPQLLKDIALQTGGQWYGNVTTKEQAEAIYRTILQTVKGTSEPCEIRWLSELDCNEKKDLKITISNIPISIDTFYTIPQNNIKFLEIKPSTLKFGKILPGNTSCLKVGITARNGDIVINNIYSTNNPPFSINTKKNFPFTLKKGSTDSLEICFNPINTYYTYGKIIIENSGCFGKTVYCIGGTPGKTSSGSSLRVIFPNKGERLYVGIDTFIIWDGIPPIDNVAIEYSTDGGNTWSLIADSVNGLMFKWSPVPNTPSNSCLARITQKNISSDELTFTELEGHTNWVVYASWSPGGSMVATSSGDMAVKIWDSYDGKLIKTLKGHKGWVNSVCWSKDSTRLLTASDDSTAIVWNFSTAQPLIKLSGHKSYVYFACWNPDNSQILTVSADGTAKIWNSNDGSLIRTLGGPNGHRGPIKYGEWSHSGEKILTASDDFTVKVWDASTGNLLRTFSGHNYKINFATWSPDDSKIAVACGDGTASVWSVNSGVRLSPWLRHSNQSVNYVEWDKKGNLLLSCGDDSLAKIWDGINYNLILNIKGHNGKVVRATWNSDDTRILTVSNDKTAIVWDNNGRNVATLKGHNQPLTFGAFDPFGNKIITASQDYTARIWSLTPPVVQKDISDSLWSIVAPNWVAMDIDFGQVPVGTTKDTMIYGYLMNLGNAPVLITNIFLSGNDASNFKISELKTPFVLGIGEKKNLGFYFFPNSLGKKQSQLFISSPSGDKVYNIIGEGIQQSVKITSGLVDFGQVEIGNLKIWDSILIKNIGTVPVTINEIEKLGPDKVQFDVLSPPGFQILPGESKSIKLQFKPIYIGKTSGKVAFKFGGKGSEAVARLFGEGIGGKVVIPDDSAYPGDLINIKILLTNVKPASVLTVAKKFKAKLRFNSSVLAVADKSIIVASANDTTYIQSIWDIQSNDGIIAQIPMYVGLGSAENTLIEFVEIQWLDENGVPVEYFTDFENGNFKVLGICKEGGPRLFKADGEIKIQNISFNPKNLSLLIEFSLIENSVTKLIITNVLGKEIKSFTLDNPKIGPNLVEFSVAELTKGVFFLTVKTQTESKTAKFLLFR